MRPIHDRMPVILSPGDYSRWLDQGNEDTGKLQPLLVPYSGEDLIAYPVSRVVNNPRNDDARCVQPIPA
jgi:putative SOS response-associated peptidase YedK